MVYFTLYVVATQMVTGFFVCGLRVELPTPGIPFAVIGDERNRLVIDIIPGRQLE